VRYVPSDYASCVAPRPSFPNSRSRLVLVLCAHGAATPFLVPRLCPVTHCYCCTRTRTLLLRPIAIATPTRRPRRQEGPQAWLQREHLVTGDVRLDALERGTRARYVGDERGARAEYPERAYARHGERVVSRVDLA